MSRRFKLDAAALRKLHPDRNRTGGNDLASFLLGCKDAMVNPSFRVAIEEKYYDSVGLGLQFPETKEGEGNEEAHP